jgi:diguanylate cyclase
MSESKSILPTYNVSPEQNSAYIRQMLPLMMKHNVPVDPMNYAIWYHYIAGINGELNNAIDNLLHDQKPFDSDITLNLYKKYICNASVEMFEEINSNLLRLISQTSLSINAASDKASVIGDSFSNTLKELEAKENDVNIKSLLVEIILQTTQLAQASKELKSQLNKTHEEMEHLRNELTEVRETANTDKLTGLLNRWAFDKALDELIKTATPEKACLAILDIDHFKRVNDSFGHLVGDKVIKHIASILKKHAAKHHKVARYGGEELAIIMPGTTLTEAFDFIEQIRHILDASRLTYKGNTETIGKVTVSAGIASFHETDSAYSIILRADKALYRAKETGRNKVVVETSLNSP